MERVHPTDQLGCRGSFSYGSARHAGDFREVMLRSGLHRLLCVVAFCSAGVADIPDLVSPIAGLKPGDIRDTYTEMHSGHPHEAIDIMSPKGTPARAVVSGM